MEQTETSALVLSARQKRAENNVIRAKVGGLRALDDLAKTIDIPVYIARGGVCENCGSVFVGVKKCFNCGF